MPELVLAMCHRAVLVSRAGTAWAGRELAEQPSIIGHRGEPSGPNPCGGATGTRTITRMPFHEPGSSSLRVLLVEDDDADALLVSELLAESGITDLRRCRRLDEALGALDADCVLLDLGLPDATDFDALTAIVEAPQQPAVIVLTGLTRTGIGLQALAHGAQDYLVKGQIDADDLERAMRYAVQRREAEETERALYRSRVRAAENARLERALLPEPLMSGLDLSCTIRYQPGRDGLLGGDFYDLVQRPDGSLLAIVGDVAGHGPDEAALGASLRTAWRALVLAGLPDAELLPKVEHLLISERDRPEIFTTAAMLVVHPGLTSGDLYLAGHHAPLLLGERCTQIEATARGRALGLPLDPGWAPQRIELGDAWRIILFTDGLIENQVPGQRDRLGADGLRDLLEHAAAHAGASTGEIVDHVLGQVREMHGSDLPDDVAVVVLERPAASTPRGGA